MHGTSVVVPRYHVLSEFREVILGIASARPAALHGQ